jgi:hypothetical protein
MASFLINTFNAGISAYENKGQKGSFKTGSSIDIRKVIDSLSCQQALTSNLSISGGATMTALGRFHVIASDGASYVFCGDGKIFKITSGDVVTLVYTDTQESGNIIGAAEFSDISGNYFLLWATPTRLNIKKIIASAYTNTEPWADVNTAPTGSWPKTNLTSTTWHTMKRAGSSLQICNDNTLAMVGSDLSYTNNSLQLIPGNVARTLLERDVNVIVGCGRKGNEDLSAFFGWDLISDNYISKKFIPVKLINALIDTDKPLAQVGTSGALYYADFLNVLPIISFTGGGSVNPDGVENDQGLALFGVFGNGAGNTGIWSYGKKRIDHPYSLNLEYPLTCDEIGSVKKRGTDIFVTYKNGSTYGIKKVDTAAKAVATYGGLDLRVPDKYIGDELPTFTHIKVTTLPLPTGTSIQVKRRIDKDLATGFLAANIEGGATSFNTVNGEEAEFLLGDKGKIIEPQVILTPSGNTTPDVLSVEIFFDLSQ